MESVSVVLVIVCPDDSRNPMRSAWMSPVEAEEMRAEIARTGEYAKQRAGAYITDRIPVVSEPAKPRRASRATRGPAEPIGRVASCIRPPRQIRASSGRWRGESNGNRWERDVIERWDR